MFYFPLLLSYLGTTNAAAASVAIGSTFVHRRPPILLLVVVPATRDADTGTDDRSDPPCGGAHDGREPRVSFRTMLLLRVSVGRPPPQEGGSRPGGRDPSKTAAQRHTGDYSHRLPALFSSFSVSLFVSCRHRLLVGTRSGRPCFRRCTWSIYPASLQSS